MPLKMPPKKSLNRFKVLPPLLLADLCSLILKRVVLIIVLPYNSAFSNKKKWKWKKIWILPINLLLPIQDLISNLDPPNSLTLELPTKIVLLYNWLPNNLKNRKWRRNYWPEKLIKLLFKKENSNKSKKRKNKAT